MEIKIMMIDREFNFDMETTPPTTTIERLSENEEITTESTLQKKKVFMRVLYEVVLVFDLM